MYVAVKGGEKAIDNAHALLANMFDDNAGESTRLLGELSAASPEDADLLWFHATRCQRKHGCDAHAAGERLVAAEPGNLANWLVVLSQAATNAGTTNDDAALDGLLARAAQSRRCAPRDRARPGRRPGSSVPG